MSQHTLEVIRTEATAPGRHPPVLFVHGSYCGAWVWREHFLPYFAERGVGSTAFSFRGHGHSEGRRSLHLLGVEDYVADLAQVAGTLEAPPLVVAHSLGAKVVQRYAERHPVAGVVFLAPVSPRGALGSAISLATGAPLLWMQLLCAQTLGIDAVDPVLLGRSLFSADLEPAARERYARRFQPESSRVALEMGLQGAWPSLTRPITPSLVIGGDQDLLIPLLELETTAATFQADLQVIPGANHLLMLDTCWKVVADRVLAWVGAQAALDRAA